MERFDLRGRRSRTSKTYVEVDDGSISLGGVLLKRPIEVPVGAIASAVRLFVIEPDDTIYAGSPRALPIQTEGDPNVVVVLRSPMVVQGFRLGAQETLPISAKERRRGVAVDLISTRVDEPTKLVAAIGALGVPTETSLPVALRKRFGVAPPDEAARVRADQRRLERRAALFSVLFIPVLIVAMATRLFAEEDVIDWSKVVTASIAGFIVTLAVAAAIASRPIDPPEARVVEEGRPGLRRSLLGIWVLLGCVALFAASFALVRLTDVPAPLAFAPVIGAPGGFVLGMLGRARRARRATEASGGPVV